MPKECAICGDIQCLILVKDPINKDENICCICRGFGYNRACVMCQLRLPAKHKHGQAMIVSAFFFLLIIFIILSSLFIIYFNPQGEFLPP